MRVIRVLYYMMRTDMAERTRRYSFLIMIGIIVFLGYSFLPPIDVISMSLKLGVYRGIYNSAWVGASVAMITAVVLSMPAFYLVKDAIERDEQTRVGEIIATTPISKPLYTIGKALSNFAYLLTMVFVIMVAALLTQLLRGESIHINVWDLTSPFIFMVIPVMGMVAALAVLFESIPLLRGGLGNVIYFFLSIFSVTMAFVPMADMKMAPPTILGDLYGVSPLVNSMRSACRAVFPNYDGSIVLGWSDLSKRLTTFVWEGVQWNGQTITGRLLWLLIAVLCALVASVFFHRFDTSVAVRNSWRFKKRVKRQAEGNSLITDDNIQRSNRQTFLLTPLSLGSAKPNLPAMSLVELRLAMKGTPLWWYLVSAGIFAVGIFSPLQVARQYVLPAALVWPLLKLSSLGTRERANRTAQIVFSTPYISTHQLLATWFSGLLITLSICSSILVRLVLSGDLLGAYALSAGILFVPSLALSSGVWVGNSKLFEVVYMLIWYMGPMNRMPFLDFVGASTPASPIIASAYLSAAAALLVLALFGRYHQIRQERFL